MILHELFFTCPPVLSSVARKTSNVYRGEGSYMFSKAQDAATVAESFRDIVMLMNAFQVSGCESCMTSYVTDVH